MDETILEQEDPMPEDDPGESSEADLNAIDGLQPTTWSAELTQVSERTTLRAERWIVDQRRRLADGLDALLIDLERRREAEIARLEEWRGEERDRMREVLDAEFERERARLADEIADERERFHEQMLGQLKAFEEQLTLRLMEQEERIGRWWDEAESMAANRFRALGLERSPKS